jgi:hypothetical protein
MPSLFLATASANCVILTMKGAPGNSADLRDFIKALLLGVLNDNQPAAVYSPLVLKNAVLRSNLSPDPQFSQGPFRVYFAVGWQSHPNLKVRSLLKAGKTVLTFAPVLHLVRTLAHRRDAIYANLQLSTDDIN